MNQLDTIVLCKHRSDRLWVNVWAKIENGRLKISGQDLGDAPKEYFGMEEFEYWYTFDKTNTDRLIALLTEGDSDIKNALYTNFNGLEGCDKLKSFCNDNGIEYEYSSWHTD